jgi:inner membrane protein YhjD
VDLLKPLRKFDRYQQKHHWLALPLAVVRKFGNDNGGNLAALVAYYAFFSLFPLLLVFVTVLGYVLQGNAGEIQSVESSVRTNFPVVSTYLKFTSLHGSVLALVIGALTSLWSGLGVTAAAQNALDTVWAVPRKNRPNFIQSKLRGAGMLVTIGVLFVIATGASGLVSGGLGSGWVTTVLGLVVSFAANVLVFLVSFRLMTASAIKTSSLLIGVVVAAVVWTVLQSIGGLYVGHVIKHMSPAYASFGFVIALLGWLYLGAQLTLYAAELNVVIDRGLWPRSLFGPPEQDADRETLEALAKVEERHESEEIEVSFRTDDPPPDAQ